SVEKRAGGQTLAATPSSRAIEVRTTARSGSRATPRSVRRSRLVAPPEPRTMPGLILIPPGRGAFMLIDVVTRRPRSPTRAALALLVFAPVLSAQLGPPPKAPPVVLQGGTLHIGNGDVVQGGTVILRGSRIEAVGKGLAIPEGAKVLDVTGRHVYPGLIDAD